MVDSVDHRVAMHSLATERRKAGKPVWQYHIKIGDIYHNDDLTFEQKRDQVVFRLKNSQWLKNAPEHEPIHEYVDELADTDCEDYFREVFVGIYDEADYARAWIDTLSA